MYQAELRGKLTHRLQKSEDILTSNVFSFFKYANRKIFLLHFLQGLGIYVSEYEVITAKFEFWPIFDDHTEPDLVLVVGDFYLLFEAKFTSSFGQANDEIQMQLVREYLGGKAEADKLMKRFILLTITAHPFFTPSIFEGVPDWLSQKILWTNWQSVTIFLEKILQENFKIPIGQVAFAEDLKNLLIEKRLRPYIGKATFHPNAKIDKLSERKLFFDTDTAKYRGVFEGFSKIISRKLLRETDNSFFYPENQNQLFNFDLEKDIETNKSPLFFRE
jgi:hypothetical protein